MFVLIQAWNGNLSSNNIVNGYETYDLAFMAMVRQLEEEVAKEGHALKEVDWNAVANGEHGDLYDEDGMWCGVFEPKHIYCRLTVWEWQIFEV